MIPNRSADHGKKYAVIGFAAAGGGRWMFSRLRQALPAEIKLIVPELPGRGRRAGCTSINDIPELVAELCDELRADVQDRPYAVFGSCFGSLVAFELLRGIRRRGLPMAKVFLVSARKPPDTAPSYRAYLGWSDEQLKSYLEEVWPVHEPNSASGALRDLIVRYLKHDIKIAAGYVFSEEALFDIPLYAYYSADGMGMSAEELKTWMLHTTGPFTFRTVSGGRDFYMSNTDQLVADMTRVMM